MEKINDFFAAQLNAPDNFTLLDFYAYGLTPSNTALRDADYYKGIDQVVKKFSDSDGNFNEDLFMQFYDSARRSYNEWANTDFADSVIKNIARSPEDITQMNNTNILDTSTKLFEVNDMWRHQRGLGNLRETGKEGYDYREVAQANRVHDADDNVLDYTPNDKGGLFKALVRKPMYIATDEFGVPLLDPETGDPYYKELRDGESHYGKDMLHYSDTLTAEDTWLNKVDFFDNDGLDKSVGGTIARTIFKVAPYLIPYVGPTLGAIGAVIGLSRSLPTIAKAINGIVTHDSDSTEFGQDLNNISAFWAQFDTTKSRHSIEHQWSFENIGDMIVTSAKQLFEQRTFTRIPEILKLPSTKLNQNLFGSLSLGYMALTSAESSLETFKKAGMSDVSAGISMLAYTAAMFGLMQTGYFKSWLFRGTWVNAAPEITDTINKQSTVVAEGLMEAAKSSAKGQRLLKLTPTATKEQAQNLFKRIFNATKEAWNKKTWDPIKAIELNVPGSVNSAKNVAGVYIHHALNEGIEEVMEEQALDVIKLISLGLERLGYDLSDDTKERIDFGLTWNDAWQRYLTSFVGGSIGGAVFQGMDDWHSKVLNNDISKYAGKGVDGELTRAIRLYGKDRVIGELNRRYKKGIANTNLAMSGKYTVDPSDNTKEIWTWDEKGDKQSQNDVVYNVLKTKINALAELMQRNGLLVTDEEVLKKALGGEKLEEAFKQLDNPIIQEIRKETKEGAEKEGISEFEYRKKYRINNFDEFAKRTGFADIIITDFGNLALDIVEIDQDIEGRKGYLMSQFPDTRASEREDAIKNDPLLKDLEEKKKLKKEQLDALLKGKAASYYIKYANFASNSKLVGNILSAQGPTVLNKDEFAFLKHHTTYFDADENEKSIIDKEYEAYIKSKGIDALERANELFEYAQNLFNPILKQQLDNLKATDLTSDIYAEDIENEEEVDPSILLDRAIRLNINGLLNGGDPKELFQNLHNQINVILNSGIDENGNPLTVGQRYHKLLDYAISSYNEMKKNNIVGLNADDFVKYMFKSISEDLLRRMHTLPLDVQSFINRTSSIILADNFNDAEEKEDIIDLLKDDPRFTEYIEKLNQARDDEEEEEIKQQIWEIVDTEKRNFLQQNRFFDKRDTTIYSDTVNRYKDILYNLYQDPEKAISLIDKFERDLNVNVAVDPSAKEAVMDMFHIDLLKSIAQKIKEAVDISKTLKVTPTIDLAKVLTFSLMGVENPLLDIIANERATLAQKGVTDYFYSNEFNKTQLEVAEKIIPIVKGVIYAATSGMNEETNKILEEEGHELLPIIPQDIAYIYQTDLEYLENQINYLRDLHNRNQGLKEREHSLVRKNFYRNVVNFFTSNTDDGEIIESRKKIQEALGDFDLNGNIEDLKLLSFDFSDDSEQNQIELLNAFTELEHRIYQHVVDKKLDLRTVAYKIFTSFNDIYKMKNGILSKNEDDTLQNFDIASYLISVVGVDSYWFGRKLKERFETEERKPFFGQELAIRLICLNLMHPEMINEAVDAVYDSTEYGIDNGKIVAENPKSELNKKQNRNYLLAKTKLKNTIIIDGFAGVGKSTVIHNIALSFFDGVNEIAVSKIKARAEGMGLDADHTYSLNELMAKVLNVESFNEKEYISSNPNPDSLHTHVWSKKNVTIDFDKIFGEKQEGQLRVLTIDECTLVKEGIWSVLVEAALRQDVRIIGLGNLMQSGETSDNGTSAGLDDCFGIFSTKLTVSMRNANSGKAANDDALGNNVAKLVDAKKEKPGWAESLALSNVSISPIILQYGFSVDKKLAGDQIVKEIDDTLIQGTIDSLNDKETLMVITPDGTFEALREKYKDNENIKFINVSNAPGDEADYVILNEKIGVITPDNKFSTLQKVYTLLTRAKKGTKIIDSIGLQQLQISNASESPTAAIDISFNPNSASAKEYFNIKLKSLNSIPEAPNEESEEEKSKEQKDKKPVIPPSKPNVIDTDYADESETLDEFNQRLETDLKEEADNATEDELKTPSNDDKSYNGDISLGSGLKGWKLAAYKKYLGLKSQERDVSVIDSKDFSDWLVETKFADLTPYHPFSKITNVSEQVETAFKEFLLGFSGIVLNHEAKQWYDLFNKRGSNLHRNELYGLNQKFFNSFEDSLKNRTGVLFKRLYNGKMIIYYCFDGYALPVTIYTPADSDFEQEFIKITDGLLFRQQTPVIPITSRGEKRSGVKSSISNGIYLANPNGNPTVVFLGPGNENYDKTNRRNSYFAYNLGRAYVMLLHEFGLSDSEIIELFRAPVENNLYTYFLNSNPYKSDNPDDVDDPHSGQNLFSIAGVQADAKVQSLLNVLNEIRTLTYGDINDESVKFVSNFFGYSEEDVRKDFRTIQAIESGDNYKENAERYRTIRNKYSILHRNDVDRIISALFTYFSNQNDSNKLSYFTENLILKSGVYTGMDAEHLRYRGFRFALKPDREFLNFYIVPTSNANSTFDIYYTGTRRESDNVKDKFNDVSISWNDLFKKGDDIKTDIKDIIDALLNIDAVREKISRIDSNFTSDKIYDLIKENKALFTFGIGIPNEDGSSFSFYSPFESDIITLITAEGTSMITEDDLSNLIKTSNIFKYGVFRRIPTTGGQIVQDQSLWTGGNVSFDDLNWDITKTLTPLYLISSLEPVDNVKSLELERIYEALLEKQVDQSALVSIQLDGQKINFARNGKSVLVPVNDDMRKLLGNSIKKDSTVSQIQVDNNSLVFTISDGLNDYIITTKELTDPRKTLFDLVKNFDGASKITSPRFGKINRKMTYNYDNKVVTLFQNQNGGFYELNIGDNFYRLKNHGSLKTKSGDYYIYLSSEAFGDKDVIHRFKTVGTDPLFDNKKTFLGYYKSMHFYSDPSGIWMSDWLDEKPKLKRVSIFFSNNDSFSINVEGVELDIPFVYTEDGKSINTFTEEGKAFIKGDNNQIRFDDKTTINKNQKTKVWIISGNLTAPVWFLRYISDYNNVIDTGKITRLDFKNKKVKINGKNYNLNSNIDESFFNDKFSQLNIKENLENWLRNNLKSIKSKIDNFDALITQLNEAEDPIAELNVYLQENKDKLNGSFKAVLNDNSEIDIIQENPLIDSVLKQVVKNNPDSNYDDYKVLIDSVEGNIQNFSVYTSDDTIVYQGIATLNQGEWDITLTNPEPRKSYNFADWLKGIPDNDAVHPYLLIAKKKIQGLNLTAEERKLWSKVVKSRSTGVYVDNDDSFIQLVSWYDAWYKAKEPKCEI